jgi:glycosyltransferase involved in cell wall biosynthesis
MPISNPPPIAAPPPAVSVILASYNRLRYLRPAVQSVLEQTLKDWELIIADDGSEGETADFLSTLADHPRVKLLKLRHTGNPSSVRNAALHAAQGHYVAFMDSDDLWVPKKLETQLSAQNASDGCRWSYSALTRINKEGSIMPGEFAGCRKLHAGAIFKQLLTLEVAVATPCVVAERSLLNEVGGFDPLQHYFEEYDLWLRMSMLSEVCAISEPLAMVRNHDEHYSADRVGVCRARLKLLDKVAALSSTSQLESVLRMERAKTATDLAAVLAPAHRIEALKMLWRSRECAWRGRKWWRSATITLIRVIAPRWLRDAVRACRAAYASRPMAT